LNNEINELDDKELDECSKELEKAMCPPEYSKMTRDELEESILAELKELKVEMHKLIDQKNNEKG